LVRDWTSIGQGRDRISLLYRHSVLVSTVPPGVLTRGMPMTLWHASICWATNGRVGAMNTTLPLGNHLV
jgi:hypothetical protein